ncbi:Hypothetical predicted protein [Olea europaea subsp. europaea]|uniref:Uncharacterized protein n=1 Tax=Olea europaea subsp. europaea TaxID=158383 RepID=A0A8S0VKW4_OLEEU|nr:Hypothetical predicted protein [Olea europaea subsp. europaea]
MSANAYPESPDAVSYEQGAVQRGIRKGGTEEVTIKEKAEQKEEEKAAEEADVPESQKEDKEDGDATTAANRSRSASGSSVVDVSLDSPAQEKEEPTFDNAETAQTMNVKEEQQEGNEDGLKTPTTANGWTHSRPPSDGSDGASVRDNKRKPQSSAATWSSIISSAVDHTDEHNFGMAPPGIHTSSLPGSDALDGTLAGILLQTMGWEHEGQEAGSWDRTVLGFDEAWQDEARDGSGSQEGNGSVAHPKEKDSYESRVEDTQPDPGLFERREDYPRKLDKGKGRATDQDD